MCGAKTGFPKLKMDFRTEYTMSFAVSPLNTAAPTLFSTLERKIFNATIILWRSQKLAVGKPNPQIPEHIPELFGS